MLKDVRLLVPWFDQQTAVRLLAGNAPTPEAVRAAIRTWTVATEAVRERRPPSLESTFRPLPPELGGLRDAFIAQSDLPNNPDFPGAEIRLVDLSSLLTFQARIASDPVTRQLIDGYDGSLASIFRVCLPVTGAMESLQVRMEGASASVVSPNPNLRFGGFRIAGGALTATFGFRPPWVQVAIYRGRPFVRNGYHRCALLLGAGARYAVAVVLTVETLADLGAAEPGYIAESHLLGPTPPMLRDFADPQISMIVAEPATQRVIRLTATEFTAAAGSLDEQAHG